MSFNVGAIIFPTNISSITNFFKNEIEKWFLTFFIIYAFKILEKEQNINTFNGRSFIVFFTSWKEFEILMLNNGN